MGNIGEPKRIIEFEPLEEPLEVEVPEGAPEEVPAPSGALATGLQPGVPS